MIVPLIYSFFFAAAVMAAMFVVFSRHAVHSALGLIVTMFSIAGIFILINAQLAAVLQVLVYAGAIMVLFLFVIMLLNLGHTGEMPLATRGVRRCGAVLGLVMAVQVAALAAKSGATDAPAAAGPSASIADVALLLMTRYSYAFEMTSALLLVAVVGAMALGRRSLSKPGRPSGPPAAG